MYIRRRIKHYQLVSGGVTLSDKLKLLILAAFYTLPNKITNRKAHTPDFAIQLSKNIRLKVNGIVYRLSHPRQLFMVSEQYERNIKPWFNRSGHTFLDIGANIGKYSIKLAKSFEEIHAFEPTEETYNVLCHNIVDNGIFNVFLHRFAAWNEDTQLTFHLKNNPGGNSSEMTRNAIATETVNAKRLDGMIETFGPVDFVKIDVEGAEVEVLEGMAAILEKWHPVLMVEVLEHNIFKVCCFLGKHGYTLDKCQNRNHLFIPIEGMDQ